MTATATPPRALDIDQFIAGYGHLEERYELVEGVPIMVPFENLENSATAVTLGLILAPILGPDYVYASQAGLHLPTPDGRDTIRGPDFVLRARTPDIPRGWRGNLTGVRLVAEMVSDSSVETDWVTKRREYAAAGIPTYLIVDVRGEQPRLYAFTTITNGRYDDPTGDGTRVDLTIDDHHITITADQIAERI